MQFLEKPNLPETDVCLSAVSATYPVLIRALEQYGIQTISVRSCGGLQNATKNHADILIHPLGGKEILIAAGEPALEQAFLKHGFHAIKIQSHLFTPYPNDVKLNAARLGKHLIANPKTIAPELTEFCLQEKIEIIPVRQGYAKCSSAIVDEHSIITSDMGIAKAVKKKNIDALLIRPGYIFLEGYDYGFIGGTCGKIGKYQIAFAGRIQDHPDYPLIRDFLAARKIEPIVLTNCPLTDIGGIIPLCIDKR